MEVGLKGIGFIRLRRKGFIKEALIFKVIGGNFITGELSFFPGILRERVSQKIRGTLFFVKNLLSINFGLLFWEVSFNWVLKFSPKISFNQPFGRVGGVRVNFRTFIPGGGNFRKLYFRQNLTREI